jgi:serralysin
MATFTAGSFGADFDQLDFFSLVTGVVQNPTAAGFDIRVGADVTHVFGGGFAYGANGFPSAGTIVQVRGELNGAATYDLAGVSLGATTFINLAATNQGELIKATVLAGADTFEGSGFADLMRGYTGDDTAHGQAGNDYLDGGAGDDDIYGDDGADTVVDPSGSNYLRGGAGADHVIGGVNFDDAHGNIGDDTVEGGFGDDWVVGGQGNDTLFGDEGGDLVYGQLGSDTASGGAGNDGMAGGQANDSLSGGAGDDFISGDRGDDTLSGGGGADIFHSAVTAETDRVLDFSVAEGDRIQLDAGSTYAVAQVGADTVITVGGSAQVVLVGVSMSSLLGSSIFLV